jgi:cytochrome P450
MRKLVAAAFTPRAVEALREPHASSHASCWSRSRIRADGALYDYAQPYSIAVICRMLGVPLDRTATCSTGRTGS